MSCITVHAARRDGISADVQRIGGIGMSTRRIGGISASCSRTGGAGVNVRNVGGINVEASLICTIGKGKYLRVQPLEPLWIDIDTSDNWLVTSNVDWEIT